MNSFLFLKSLLLALFIFIGFSAKAQYDSLHIVQLQNDIETLKQLLTTKDSMEHESIREDLMNGFHNSYLLYDKIEIKKTEISNQQTTIRLLNLNNPGTAQMIKQFETFMKDLVADKLSSIIRTDNVKKAKIWRILESIFNNPVITPVLNSNPISAAISSAYNFISSLVEPKAEIQRTTLGGVKDISVELSNFVDNSALGKITEELVPYIKFFDTLYIINNQFNTRLTLLKQDAKSLSESYSSVWNYYKGLGIQINESPVQKQRLFERTFPTVTNEENLLKYALYANDEKIKTALKYGKEVALFYNQLNNLTEEYNTAINDFRNQYIDILERYKDRLKLYTTNLNEAYNELTNAGNIVSNAVVTNSNQENSGSVQPGPEEEKVWKAQWRYNTTDWSSKELLNKMF